MQRYNMEAKPHLQNAGTGNATVELLCEEDWSTLIISACQLLKKKSTVISVQIILDSKV